MLGTSLSILCLCIGVVERRNCGQKQRWVGAIALGRAIHHNVFAFAFLYMNQSANRAAGHSALAFLVSIANIGLSSQCRRHTMDTDPSSRCPLQGADRRVKSATDSKSASNTREIGGEYIISAYIPGGTCSIHNRSSQTIRVVRHDTNESVVATLEVNATVSVNLPRWASSSL